MAERCAVPYYGGAPCGHAVCLIVVNDTLYSYIAEKLWGSFVLALEDIGYAVNVYRTEGGTPEDLRAWFIGQNLPGLDLTSIFIGDLPVAMVEIPEGWDNGAPFPCDLFYMDLDGAWQDDSGNGVYDYHGGAVEADIRFGRWTARPLTLGYYEEAVLVNRYMDKVAAFRGSGPARRLNANPIKGKSPLAFRDGTVGGGTTYTYTLEAVLCGGNVYDAGLVTVAVPAAVATALTSPFPNPTRAGVTAAFVCRTARPTLAVYDAAGRRVCTFNIAGAGKGKVRRRSDDDRGRSVPSGLYVLRLQDGGEAVSRRIVATRN